MLYTGRSVVADRLSFHDTVENCDLLSFPTRRSSDLLRSVDEAKRAGRPQAIALLGNAASVYAEVARRGLVFDVEHEAAPRDRKSTRLNSSHRTISYAVFCLKNKKIQTQLWCSERHAT